MEENALPQTLANANRVTQGSGVKPVSTGCVSDSIVDISFFQIAFYNWVQPFSVGWVVLVFLFREKTVFGSSTLS